MQREESSEIDTSNMRITFDSLKFDFDIVRKKIFKEMEIEKIQNKIYLKLRGHKKTNNFIFERCDDRSEFYKGDDETIKDEKKTENDLESLDVSEEDDSDIVDLDNIPDESEEVDEMPKSKFLDIEAEEGSSIEEIEGPVDDFDYEKDIINQEKMLERFERKYMRKKEKRKKPKMTIEDLVSSSSENLDFQEIEAEEEKHEFEKDEESLEIAEPEEQRRFDN